MNAVLTDVAAVHLPPLEIELLSEEDCRLISGGGAVAIGCLMLAGGAAAVIAGVVIGVALYAILH